MSVDIEPLCHIGIRWIIIIIIVIHLKAIFVSDSYIEEVVSAQAIENTHTN